MKQLIRVTREFTFEMAHVLYKYDGPCRNVHGHSYRLFVTVAGVPVNNTDDPKNGMVIDFTDLKGIVLGEIVDVFDHSVVVSKEFDSDSDTAAPRPEHTHILFPDGYNTRRDTDSYWLPA